MQPASARRWIPLVFAVASLVALQLLGASSASAGGTWTSKQCDSASGSGAPDAVPFNSGGGAFALSNGCTSPNFGERELAVAIPGNANYGEFAEWGFNAPTGTVFSDMSFDALLETSNNAQVRPDLYYLQGGEVNIATGNHPTWQTYSTGGGQAASHLGAALSCVDPTPGACRPLNGGVKIADVNIAVTDTSAPPAPSVSGPFVADAWVRQSPNLQVNASDVGGGVAGVPVIANAQTAGFQDTCNEAYVPGTSKTQRLAPCGSSASPTFSALNTAQAPFQEGANDVFVCTAEFGSNPAQGCVQRTVNVDNVAPGQPNNFTLAGGSGWRSANDFDVSWGNPPDSGSPLAGAVYEIVNQQGQTVEGPTFVSGSTTSLSDIDVPGPGEYTLRVRVRDSAGNESPAVLTTVRFDNTPPGASQPRFANGWLSRNEFPYVQRWQPVDPSQVPPSGIKGYAVVVDRSASTDPCDPTGSGDPTCSDAEITQMGEFNLDETINDPPEGSNYVHVVAVSNANVPSGGIRHTELKVDKTDPNVELQGVPQSPTTNEPVTLAAEATDALSGMQPLPNSDDGQPRTVIEVNGQVYEESGEDVSVTLNSDGHYTARYWARDLAGNETPGGDAAHTVSFTINNLAPDLDIKFKAKKRVKAGGKTNFTGYVHAAKAVIPPIGKLIEVQAKVGKQWKTVGEAFRTDSQGNFKLKYRFRKFYTQPTRFRFRLKVLPEPGWPYSQPVYSKKRKVKVIPRGH